MVRTSISGSEGVALFSARKKFFDKEKKKKHDGKSEDSSSENDKNMKGLKCF